VSFSDSNDDASDPAAAVVKLLTRLPGVGAKSARRMAYSLLERDPSFAHALGESIAQLPARVCRCARCGVFTQVASGEEPAAAQCGICRDARRTEGLLCVVARPWDVDAFERAGFRGRYHVLHALLDPLGGMGPDEFPMREAIDHVRDAQITEVILATPATVEGEATSLFLAEGLRPLGVKVTRIASGIPHGGDLEYADPITLTRALEGRRGL